MNRDRCVLQCCPGWWNVVSPDGFVLFSSRDLGGGKRAARLYQKIVNRVERNARYIETMVKAYYAVCDQVRGLRPRRRLPA